jgi:hypothetical protein
MLAHVDYLLCDFNVLTGEGLVSTHSDEFLDRPFELGGQVVEGVTFRMAKGVVAFLESQLDRIDGIHDDIGAHGTEQRREFVWGVFRWFIRDYDRLSEWYGVADGKLAVVIDWYVNSIKERI